MQAPRSRRAVLPKMSPTCHYKETSQSAVVTRERHVKKDGGRREWPESRAIVALLTQTNDRIPCNRMNATKVLSLLPGCKTLLPRVRVRWLIFSRWGISNIVGGIKKIDVLSRLIVPVLESTGPHGDDDLGGIRPVSVDQGAERQDGT
ncbi:hypothetical protein GN956_G20033 [Arapaima gigas]